MAVNDALLNRGIRHAVFLEQLATREVNHMVRFMDSQLFPDIKRTLDRRLARVAASGQGWMTTKRYQTMMKTLDGQIRGAMSLMGKTARQRLTRIAATEAQMTTAMLRQEIPLTLQYNAPPTGLVRSIVTARPFQGKLLREWYGNLGQSLRSGIRDQINIGLASGESVPKITRRIMGTRLERGFTGASTRAATRRQVRAVVRTSTNHVAAAAREATYEANKDIIKRVRYVATLDARTTDICMSLDGQEYKLGQGPRPPSHHQCRSTTVPITMSWRELGIKGAKDARVGGRVFRNVTTGMNGVSPKPITYGNWLKGQEVAVQNTVLGTRRAQLFRKGRVAFDRFFENGRMMTLHRLAEREGVRISGAMPRLPVTRPTPPPAPEPAPVAPRAATAGEELTGAEVREKILEIGAREEAKIAAKMEPMRQKAEAANRALVAAEEELDRALAKVGLDSGKLMNWRTGGILETEEMMEAAKAFHVSKEGSRIWGAVVKNQTLALEAERVVHMAGLDMKGYVDVREILAVRNPAKVRLSDHGKVVTDTKGTRTTAWRTEGKMTPDMAERVEEANRFIKSVVSEKVYAGPRKIPIHAMDTTRKGKNAAAVATDGHWTPHAAPKGMEQYGVTVATEESVSVMVHEITHHIEYYMTSTASAGKTNHDLLHLLNKLRPRASKLGRPLTNAEEYVARKLSGGLEGDMLAETMKAGYASNMYVEDLFPNLYWGRVYAPEVGGGMSTEMLSMGVQALHDDAYRFARNHPEWFEWTVNTIRGIKVDPVAFAEKIIARMVDLETRGIGF